MCSFLPHSSALTIASFCLSKLKSAQIDVYEKYPCWTEDQNFKINQDIVFTTYGNTGCRVFKERIQNLKDYWVKINIPNEIFLILGICVMGRYQKVQIFDFQSQFSISKFIGIFLNFFFMQKYQFMSTFFIIDIFL